VLYWVTNNTLTIVQQLITDRFMFRNKTLISAEAEQSGSTNA
jgi:membrane protein insertase Oxa1/YidC/SpoIIIJ